MISENSVHFTFDGGNTYDVVEPQTAAETQMNSSRSIHSEKGYIALVKLSPIVYTWFP